MDFGLTRVDCKYNDSLHVRVKSVNFRCQVNLDIYLQTVEILMRRLLIRIFTVCLVNYFFRPIINSMKQTRRCPNLPDV